MTTRDLRSAAARVLHVAMQKRRDNVTLAESRDQGLASMTLLVAAPFQPVKASKVQLQVNTYHVYMQTYALCLHRESLGCLFLFSDNY